MCEITTAGRLQVQISFPSASLLIKQLNGQKKVVLRVKSVKEKGKDVRAHTQTRHVLELDPEIQYLAFRLTGIPNNSARLISGAIIMFRRTSTSVLQQKSQPSCLLSFVSVSYSLIKPERKLLEPLSSPRFRDVKKTPGGDGIRNRMSDRRCTQTMWSI